MKPTQEAYMVLSPGKKRGRAFKVYPSLSSAKAERTRHNNHLYGTAPYKIYKVIEVEEVE